MGWWWWGGGVVVVGWWGGGGRGGRVVCFLRRGRVVVVRQAGAQRARSRSWVAKQPGSLAAGCSRLPAAVPRRAPHSSVGSFTLSCFLTSAATKCARLVVAVLMRSDSLAVPHTTQLLTGGSGRAITTSRFLSNCGRGPRAGGAERGQVSSAARPARRLKQQPGRRYDRAATGAGSPLAHTHMPLAPPRPHTTPRPPHTTPLHPPPPRPPARPPCPPPTSCR